ncbi:MAG: GatB/YqeY domain-containing protein [Bacilli bacterium]|nr:GatB/YqeY domain-containing protein [Bacilli bacterium]
MREKILEDLKQAMKEQDKELLSVIRMVKGAIQLEEIKVKHPLTDEEVITILSREIKTRKESISEFEKGNRTDLIEKTQSEVDILSRYMPEQLSEEEVNQIIEEVFGIVNPNVPSDMGKIMGMLTPKLKGKTDMSLVSKKVKEKLTH